MHDISHNKKRRARWHNYSEPGTYMLTIATNGRRPLFGMLVCNAHPYVQLSSLGEIILNEEIHKIMQVYPMVEVWKICIMPDHIHLIVHVKEKMPPKKHLGQVIGAFKGGCSRAWWNLTGANAPGTVAQIGTDNAPGTVAQIGTDNAPGTVAGRGIANAQKPSPLFEEGYNDRILLDDGQLDRWKHYLDDNPRRLMMKRQHPDLFTILHDIDVCGYKCQAIGNQFLLDIPDMMAVIVHRKDSESEFDDHYKKWMACGERGGVLVSASIAPREKLVMREAMNRGYKIILLRENGFPMYYKPSGEAFDACANGLLCQISPWDYHYDSRTITRTQCLNLNALALSITANR